MRSAVLLAIVWLAPVAVLHGQRPGDVSVDVSLGRPVAVGKNDFAAAYRGGQSLGLGIGVSLPRALTLRGLFEMHVLYYDRPGPGLTRVSLRGGISANAKVLDALLNLEWAPIHRRDIRPYVVAGLGYLRLDTEAARVAVFSRCTRPTLVVKPGGVISVPTDWKPPEYCEQATRETSLSASGLATNVGLGVEVFSRLVLDARYLRGFGVSSAIVPLRVGWVEHF